METGARTRSRCIALSLCILLTPWQRIGRVGDRDQVRAGQMELPPERRCLLLVSRL